MSCTGNYMDINSNPYQPGDLTPDDYALGSAMSRVTDAYGPIPYSKIGQDGKITIPYDTQAEVYNAFFKELDESIEVDVYKRQAKMSAVATLLKGEVEVKGNHGEGMIILAPGQTEMCIRDRYIRDGSVRCGNK